MLPGHEHEAFIPYSSIYSSELPPEDPPPAKPVTQSLQSSPAGNNQSQSTEQNSQQSSGSARAVPTKLLVDDAPTSGGAETFSVPPRDSQDPALSYSPGSRSSEATARSEGDTLVSPHASSNRTSWAGEEDYESLGSDVTVDQPVGAGDMEKKIEEDVHEVAAHSSLPFKVASLDVNDSNHTKAQLEADLTSGDTTTQNASDQDHEKPEELHPHLVLQATVTNISENDITVAPQRNVYTDDALTKLGHAPSKKLWSIDQVSIPYDFLVYALGSTMPDPLRSDARTKTGGMHWMKDMQNRILKADKIVIVGGGALGVEYALDIATIFPEKASSVTLLHSRKQLLPSFDPAVHEVVVDRLKKAGVNIILGERLALAQGCPLGSAVSSADKDKASMSSIAPSPLDQPEGQKQLIRTTAGRELEADLLMLCTGQQPNSSLMAQFSPSSVDPNTRLVKVARTLQVQADPATASTYAPFNFRPPCGDCDCFVERKSGAEHPHLSPTQDEEEEPQHVLPNVYAIGDVADAFGAINAGYQAWSMADVAARSIVQQIRVKENVNLGVSGQNSQEEQALDTFTPAPAMLKLSLGLGSMVFQGLPGDDGKPQVEVRDDPEDLGVKSIWRFMAKASTEDMYR